MTMPQIEVALHAGVCYGVERALELAKNAATGSHASISTLGPLIHNPLVVQELEDMGIQTAQTLEDCSDGTVIIRAHGVVPQVEKDAVSKGLAVVDATCPYVKKAQHAARRLVEDGYQVLVVGESGHPEVEGIVGHTDNNAFVISGSDELEDISFLSKKVGIVVQTTQTIQTLQQVVDNLLPQVDELKVVNTICAATKERQESAAELAQRADVMIVIGGKNSGNTRRLFEICADLCDQTYLIESPQEIEPAWVNQVDLIGVTAGASTPADHISQTVGTLSNLLKNTR